MQIVRADTDKDTRESEGALDKIRQRFFDDILCPKVLVKAIRSKLELTSFRIGKNQEMNLEVPTEEMVKVKELKDVEKAKDIHHPAEDEAVGGAEDVDGGGGTAEEDSDDDKLDIKNTLSSHARSRFLF